MQPIQINRDYKVVVNHEEQYSIWPADGKNPLGWKDVGILGSRRDCFAFIEKVGIDARPLSCRKKVAAESNRV